MGTMQRPDAAVMADAGADFRKSIAMFETLMGEERGDPLVIRRYFADALGLRGMGCYLRFTQRPTEAEQFYRRAMELRRDLICGKGAGDVPAPDHTSTIAAPARTRRTWFIPSTLWG